MSITMTTTHSIETRDIIEYKGIVYGAVGVRNMSLSIETQLINMVNEMKQKAHNLGANAIVGVMFADHLVYGTAVVVK